MKTSKSLLVFLSICSFAFAVPVSEVPNLRSPQKEVFTSGQPNEQGFEELSRLGIKTVINVLPERNCEPGEAGIVTSNHMVYKTVPFHLSKFRKETIEQFAEVLKHAQKPVLIHCGTGNHAGGLWFAYRVLIRNVPLEVALGEGRMIGMRKELENILVPWVVQNHSEF